jgi:hypothetical protein
MWTVTNIKYRLEDGIAIKVEAKYQLVTDGIITSNTIWVNLTEPTENVTPFEELTEQQVLSWVFANYDTNTVELKVLDDHNKKLNLGLGERLPWVD